VGDRDLGPLAAGADPNPEVGGAEPLADPDPADGDGKRQGPGGAGEQDRVPGGIEERRVQGEAGGFAPLLLLDADLGVDLLARSPGRSHALEGGAVFQAGGGEQVVELLDVDRLGPGRGPGAGVEVGCGCLRAGEGADGVAGPGDE